MQSLCLGAFLCKGLTCLPKRQNEFKFFYWTTRIEIFNNAEPKFRKAIFYYTTYIECPFISQTERKEKSR